MDRDSDATQSFEISTRRRGPWLALSPGVNKLVLGVLALLCACRGSPDETPWCSDELGANVDPAGDVPATSGPLTYFRDVEPIVKQKCAFCHSDGGIAPFAFNTSFDVASRAVAIRDAITERRMPPWMAARCCRHYQDDWSLTQSELDTIVRWIDEGTALGDPAEAPPERPAIGGLSRVDVTLTMPEAYTPSPRPGESDEGRCFVIDWPRTDPVYVTGMNPRPGNRHLVHHLVVGVVGPEDAEIAAQLDAADPGPGFDCAGGPAQIRNIVILGGGMLGNEFPGGLGLRVEKASKVILAVHYHVGNSHDGESDQTAVELRLDTEAKQFGAIPVANAAWLVGSGMKIEAGDSDAAFFYQFKPTLFTQKRPIQIWGAIPHMHNFGTRFVLRVVRASGERECLLEVSDWNFGWEQPFWFTEPTTLGPDDSLYVECHFDNSAENQPNGMEPRDIGWGGNDQDMCVGFVNYVTL